MDDVSQDDERAMRRKQLRAVAFNVAGFVVAVIAFWLLNGFQKV